MSAPAARRGLVPIEIAAVVAASLVPLPIPAVVPLLAVASASLWWRGRSWTGVAKGPSLYAAIGAAVGLAALALALVGTPLVERVGDDAIVWSSYPVVRGSPTNLVVVALVVGLGSLAAELVLRGWLVERVLELGGGNVLAILAGALAEALLADGGVIARIGAGGFGIALGWMYFAAGRSVVAPLCARLAFALGALALEATRVIG